ncbi:MAG: hypothetical protein KatS3mg106_265 [Gemmataceae bacterium]|uniref:Uncharacterized protein n=1 Tax=Thermogemmata fonticola TaxID=2755323 RepID=A0A7V9AD98_9BACT|nr:hypothetical protein [Thermogemmata fonticola]MBA2227813.1 hypothetical protein [Thermogemmata fonticola]GIW83752.1 MAG: hypothetical protein KatS3mg106_265 [Gemmataceae bacterium]
MLEERAGGETTVQYVWSPLYVDALILRDRDTNGDGSHVATMAEGWHAIPLDCQPAFGIAL